jgi:uncharacterized membrane protein YhhN
MDAHDRLARWVLIASVIGGVSYVATWPLGLPVPLALVWKGSGVGLLAVYAGLKARDRDGWLLAVVMAFGALGDVLLHFGLVPGALAFLAGHLVAIGLYMRHRRTAPTRSQELLARALVPATVAIAWLLTHDGGAMFYALCLSLMVAAAWTSRFPRFVVGVGALMFLVSDLLIFARSGHRLPDNLVVGIAVWGLYYVGQLLICVGVARALKHWRETEERVDAAST